MANSRRCAAVMDVHLEILAEVLKLPEGVRITHVIENSDTLRIDSVRMRITGDCLPEVEDGRCLPIVKAEYETVDGVPQFRKFIFEE